MRPITPRNLDLDLSRVPRRWMASNAFATALANGINLMFPQGERYVVRAVNQFADQLTDPQLVAAVRGFFGQEGRHARAHDELNQLLRDQGFEIDQFLTAYKWVIATMERYAPAKLNLAVAAAAEHFTAILAEGAFAHDVLDAAVPEMRALLAWHAAEEIEHKAVTFDVLQAVDPSYPLRIAGLAFATVIVGGAWVWGVGSLIRQVRRGAQARKEQRRRDGVPERAKPANAGHKPPQRTQTILGPVFLRGIRQYLARGFHPDDNANDRLASDWMAARGMSLPGSEAA
jgi:uncharacterized protein